MDWELPAWEAERLETHAAGLKEKVETQAAHKEKQSLLGKVEAALWLRKEEPPIALHMMTIEQLRKLLAKLHAANGAPAPADAKPSKAKGKAASVN